MRVIYSTGGLYSLIKAGNGEAFLDGASEVECSEYEFMIFNSAGGTALAKDMLSAGLSIPVVHARKQIGGLLGSGSERDAEEALAMFEADARAAREMGAETVVVHLWGAPHSDKHIEHVIRRTGGFLEAAAREGVMLAAENVPCVCADPFTHMRALLEAYPDIRFTCDARLVCFHGQMGELEAADWLWPRLQHVHISDYSGGVKNWERLGTIRHMGEGEVDLDRFMRALGGHGYDGLVTIECMCVEEGCLDVKRMNENLTKVRGFA